MFLAAVLVLGAYTQALAAATLLPPGEQCFQATTGTSGMVGSLGTITAGSGGTSGTYGGVALTGGTGSGATANITVSGGGVTAVTILNPGTQFVVGDVLSAASGNIGSVTGFSVPVNSVSINSSLAGGQVFFYIPNTSSLKQTWSNSTQTTLNTNPVLLDQNGCAVIYGTGSYRQVVQDSLGNTVWDKLTTDTSANNNTFWAGTASGSPNVITVVDPGFNATDGTIINFSPLFSNTGPATLNPSGFGAIPIVKDTTGGPIALTGAPSEIVAATPSTPNVVSVLYSAQQNNFHLLNTVIPSASGATAPLCGASGLQIVNNTSTPTTIINMTAAQAVMQTTAGLVINRSSVSLTAINISTGTSTATANGMDGESAGTSQWLNVFMIDNGAAPAGLVSTSSTAPTMPSGYTYKCLMGAIPVDGSGNLYRIQQSGRDSIYNIQATGNTATVPVPTGGSGVVGTFSVTSPAMNPITVRSATFTAGGQCAPPIASAVWVAAWGQFGGGTGADVLIAPSTAWGGTNRGPTGISSQSYPIVVRFSGSNLSSSSAMITLVADTIGFASNAAGGAVQCFGWRNAVNAN